MNFYAHEKVRELERQRLEALKGRPKLNPERRKPIFGPLASTAGRTLRRLGEGLETWANPPAPEPKRPFRYDRP